MRTRRVPLGATLLSNRQDLHPFMKKTISALALIFVVSCGSSGPQSTPGTPTQPTPPAPAPPVNTWSVVGTLVDTTARQAISGATVAPSWDLTSVQTGSDGGFELGAVANPPTNPYRLTVSGSDLVSRELWITWQRGSRAGITIDAIRNRAPFNMEFYRQLVRGTYDNDGPHPVFRWMDSPRFYLKTVDQNGRPIEPEVLAIVREALPRAVHEFSAGVLSAVLETGTETRSSAGGWINVDILRDPNQRSTCGRALVGANPGTITLYNDVCSCGSNKIPGSVVVHEVGHAMGFFHVPDRNSVMYPFDPGSCPSGILSAAEKFHAAIAYTRPRGNRDPDIDPPNGPFLRPTQGILVER
jgi:hypothetical protein